MLSEQIAALTRLGVAPDKASNLEDADHALRDALSADPNNPELMKALGTVLRLRGQTEAAAAYYRAALQRNGADGAAHCKLGMVLADQGRLDEAIDAWRMAVHYAPNDPSGHCCLAIGLLLRGDYREAWPEYEWRRRLPAFSGLAEPNVPIWDGTPLQGRALLAFAEQGNGDSLQFARFLSRIEGGKTIVRCPAALKSVVSRLPGVFAVAAPGEPLPQPVDVQIALPSLPGVFQTALPEISGAAYLAPDPERLETWRRRLAAVPGRKIGLVWAGNPRHADNAHRSLPADLLCWLPRLDGLSYLGLQVGENAADADRLAGGFGGAYHNLSGDLRDFDDTAAVLSLCDVLISVDTAAVHLAGALGRPVWVLLPYSPDWRWMTQRSDSPWYDSARLYRQETPGGWDGVMTRIGRDLRALAASSFGETSSDQASSDRGSFDGAPLEEWTKQVTTLAAAGKGSEAEALCWRMSGRQEHVSAAFAMLGGLRLRVDDAAAAVRMITFGLSSGPPTCEAFSNLGVALRRQGRMAEAQHAYRRAIALNPNATAPTFNLANLLSELGHCEEALPLYRQTLNLDATHSGAHYNHANALRDLGRFDEAFAAYRRALTLQPEDAEVHNSLGMCLLLAGRFKEGWEEYAWRKRCAGLPDRNFDKPLWDGRALAAGETLLIHAEQGFGDAVQFLRYAVPAKRRAAGRVILEVQPGLASLCRTLPEIDLVVEQGRPLPNFDVQASLIDLARIFNTRRHTIPHQTPYLAPSAARVEKWRAVLASATEKAVAASSKGGAPGPNQAAPYRVGLVWAGNPRHKNDHRRSLPLSAFTNLPLSAKIAYFSLQVGDRRADLARDLPNAPIIDLGAHIADFEDAAAIMIHLDLVVACDTAAAHLAGALGRAVWTLLPFAPDWRWMRDGSDTQWYPSMRLLRQAKPNDWSGPLATIAADLLAAARGETAESLCAQAEAAIARAEETTAAVLLSRVRALWPRGNPAPRLSAKNAERRLEEARKAVKSNDAARAETLFKEIIAEAPDFMPPLAEYGLFCLGKKRPVEAAAAFQRIAPRTPTNASVHYNLALALQSAGQLDEAEECLRHALTLDPASSEAVNDLGALLFRAGRFEEAKEALKQCLAMNPDSFNAMGNLSVALRSQGLIEEALFYTRRALALQPDSAELHWNLSILLLLSGDFENGWPEFEWRWKLPNFPSPTRNFTQPQWRGEPLEGRTVLIHAEQGFGDTLNFVRYVPLVAARGGRVVLEVQPQVRALCRCIPDVAELRSWGDPLPTFDLHIPMLSLPLVLGASANAVLVGCPYLAPSPAVLERWAERLPRPDAGPPNADQPDAGRPTPPPLRVGLVWAGSVIHSNNRNRSLALARLAPLARIPNVRFYSLQKGDAVLELHALRDVLPCVNLDPYLTDFEETAGAIAQLDLVITVDTAVAHLVGAMRRPIWCMIAAPPDWRWMLEREDTPYYPTMRLFRQRKGGAWDDVIARVVEALDAYQKERFADPSAPSRAPGQAPGQARSQAPGSPPEDPFNADVVFAKALDLHLKGRLAEAEVEYRRITTRPPSGNADLARRADAFHHLGLIFRQANRPADAERQIRQALEINPKLVGAWSNLGVVLREAGRPTEAADCYRQALRLEPDHADALYNLGNALRQIGGRLDEAIACLQRAIALQPQKVGMLNNYGLMLKEAGRLAEAEQTFRDAQARSPQEPMALANLALVLHDLDRDAEAVALCEPMTTICADDAFFWRAFGLALKGCGRLEEALSAYDCALSLNAASGDGHQVRASCLIALGRIDEASQAIDRALELTPGHAESLWIRGFIDMLSGRLETGWEGMERRWQSKMVYPTGARFPSPAWDGRPLNGGTLLIHAEQGLGDAIHFIRYAEMAAARGARVIAEAQKPLARLFASVAGVDRIAIHGEPPPPFDAHISVMSLPHVFRTSLSTIPAKIPYLQVDPALKAAWAARLAVLPPGARKIGLVWAGNPTYKNDKNRSLSLEALSPILSLPGLAFVSLQKEGGTAAIQAQKAEILDIGSEFSDFADTAAVLSNLDLAITVDTSVAHCAGALGVPTWVFLPFAPDWRWMLDRVDSPWYPTMRLYRQPRREDWTPVVARMAADLR